MNRRQSNEQGAVSAALCFLPALTTTPTAARLLVSSRLALIRLATKLRLEALDFGKSRFLGRPLLLRLGSQLVEVTLDAALLAQQRFTYVGHILQPQLPTAARLAVATSPHGSVARLVLLR